MYIWQLSGLRCVGVAKCLVAGFIKKGGCIGHSSADTLTHLSQPVGLSVKIPGLPENHFYSNVNRNKWRDECGLINRKLPVFYTDCASDLFKQPAMPYVMIVTMMEASV